ncbi:MAG: hypothetical protein ACHQM6_10545, partial [Candidatus Kapaibacterium sp.]
IELYNNSSHNAHLDSTLFRATLGSKYYYFVIDSLTLIPKQYAVISADSNLFTAFPLLQGKSGVVILNKIDLKIKDTGNQVMLLNIDSTVIDSLHFYPTWHTPYIAKDSGHSLERKIFDAPSNDQNNWGSSLDTRGSTPLEKNSFLNDTIPAAPAIKISISPNPFSPDGDGFEDITYISIAIPSDKEEMISAKLYDLRGRLRSTIPTSQFGYLRSASIPFAGKDDNGITLPIGLYTLVVESASGLFKSQRTGVVIMKKGR